MDTGALANTSQIAENVLVVNHWKLQRSNCKLSRFMADVNLCSSSLPESLPLELIWTTKSLKLQRFGKASQQLKFKTTDKTITNYSVQFWEQLYYKKWQNSGRYRKNTVSYMQWVRKIHQVTYLPVLNETKNIFLGLLLILARKADAAHKEQLH